jgi:hypothetical protein
MSRNSNSLYAIFIHNASYDVEPMARTAEVSHQGLVHLHDIGNGTQLLYHHGTGERVMLGGTSSTRLDGPYDLHFPPSEEGSPSFSCIISRCGESQWVNEVLTTSLHDVQSENGCRRLVSDRLRSSSEWVADAELLVAPKVFHFASVRDESVIFDCMTYHHRIPKAAGISVWFQLQGLPLSAYYCFR